MISENTEKERGDGKQEKEGNGERKHRQVGCRGGQLELNPAGDLYELVRDTCPRFTSFEG